MNPPPVTIKSYLPQEKRERTKLSPIYTKGVVMDDGIHIRPIQFWPEK